MKGQRGGSDLNLFRQTYNKNNIVYKNILSLEKEGKEMPCPTKNNACQQENEQLKNDLWQMYQKYADSALANIDCNNTQANYDYGNNQGENAENISCPQKCCNIKSNEACEPNIILMQLDRMEKMLKEIYMCNQELCKSLVNYCCKYQNE